MPWIVHENKMAFVEDHNIFESADEAVAQVIGSLSAPAYAILQYAPAAFRNGRVVPLRTLAGLAGYSNHLVIYRGVLELVQYGFVVAKCYGPSRHQYAGIPQIMRSSPVLRLRRHVYQAA